MTRLKESIHAIVGVIFVVSVICGIWLIAFRYSLEADLIKIAGLNNGDLAGLLFGVSSIALTIVAIIIGVAALFGWQVVERALIRIAQKTADETVKSLDREYKGRISSALGYFIGEANKESDFIHAKDVNKMNEAVSLCQQGYEFLKPIGGPGMYMALNNLVYYMCIDDDPVRRDFVLQGAGMLMSKGQEYGAINLQLTACRAILQYESDMVKVRDAYSLVGKTSASRKASDLQKEEARQYAAYFSQRMSSAAVTTPANGRFGWLRSTWGRFRKKKPQS